MTTVNCGATFYVQNGRLIYTAYTTCLLGADKQEDFCYPLPGSPRQ